MKQKRGLKRARQGIALSVIFNLILAILAFGFVLNINIGMVSSTNGLEEFRKKLENAPKGANRYFEGDFYQVDSKYVKVYKDGEWVKGLPAGLRPYHVKNLRSIEERLRDLAPSKPPATTAGGASGIEYRPLNIKEERALQKIHGMIEKGNYEEAQRMITHAKKVSTNTYFKDNLDMFKDQVEYWQNFEETKEALNEALNSGNFEKAEESVEKLGTEKETKKIRDAVKQKKPEKAMEELEKLKNNKEDEFKMPEKASAAGSTLSGAILPESYYGWTLDAIISGAQWAVAAAGAGYMIGSLLGLEGQKTRALAAAFAAAGGVGKALSVAGGKGGLIQNTLQMTGDKAGWIFTKTGTFQWYVPWVGGIAAGLIVLELMWQSKSQQIIKFECRPWEAPTGGNDCQKCNSDLYPCSEYRCRALGQACKLVNKGTEEQKCIWKNPNDVSSPRIEAWEEALQPDFSYTDEKPIPPQEDDEEVPGRARIKYKGGCVKPFTPLQFGVKTDEPSQCKIDYNQTGGLDEMKYYFGGSNLFDYNHTQQLRLPGPNHVKQEAPEIKADGNYSLYVRCKDANGNYNPGSFVFKFCVQKGPDVTPPKIEGTSIRNGQPIQFGLNQTPIELYVNEPAECRWSRIDQAFENMNNSMSCDTHIYEMNNQMLYRCSDTLTGLQDYKDNYYYFRCKDQPLLEEESDRNVNKESFDLLLKGSQPLDIKRVSPNKTISGYTSPTKVLLEVETANGAEKGKAWCSYSPTGEEGTYTQMLNTGDDAEQVGSVYRHTQRLDLPAGQYQYYYQCVDKGGNADYDNTTFSVEIDEEAPVVVRAYQESNKLKVITDEKSVCSYSNDESQGCDFSIDKGQSMPNANSTDHFAEWNSKNFYIKCMDERGRRPLPTECSIVVRPERE